MQVCPTLVIADYTAGLNHPNSNGSGLCSGDHCSLCGKFVLIAHCVEVSEASLRHFFQTSGDVSGFLSSTEFINYGTTTS